MDQGFRESSNVSYEKHLTEYKFASKNEKP